MSDINVIFCRHLLARIMADVRRYVTKEEVKAAWVYRFSDGHYEFHGPGRGPVTDPINSNGPPNFYWYGPADNAYDARAQGWQAWLEHYHPEQPK